jgi:hypothetical protein
MHQQMTQKRRPRINFINSWSGLTQPAQVMTKLVMGVANAKVGRETLNQPTIGKHSLYESTNENGLRLVDFAAGRHMAIKSTYFMYNRIHLQTWHSPDRHTFNLIDHCLIDGRHFSNVIDVMARKFTIHKALIRPVLLYGSETWVSAKREEKQLLERYAVRQSKMVSTGGGTTTNSIKSLTALMP